MDQCKPPLKKFSRDPGDVGDLVLDLEKIFQVVFDDPEAEKVSNVGELYEYIMKRIEFPDKSSDICLSAVAFHRVKKAMIRLVGKADFTPRTELKDITQEISEGGMLKKFWYDLEITAGLKLPQLVYEFQWRFPWSGPRIPESCETVGDLANMAFAFNYRALSREYASYRKSDVWKSLGLILEDWHPCEKHEITQTTSFL